MFRRLLLVVGMLLAGGGPAAAWLPAPGDAFDIQLTTPFQLERRVATLATGLHDTSSNRLLDLKARGVRTICLINAGAWENWRPDAGAFDQRQIGADFAGWPGERWLDIRAQDALRPVLARRLDLCRSKGFDGVLLRNVDGYEHRTGFPLTAEDQLNYDRWLAAEARSRGLAVGMMNALELAPALVNDVDFVVIENCFDAVDACAGALEYRKADKPVYVVEYTNIRRKMDAYCAQAADLDVQLIFKTKSLNGKLHRRCP